MKPRILAIAAAALLVILVLGGAFYTIQETEQIVMTHFGKPIGEPFAWPGLHVKVPFIQKVKRFERRWLEWDGEVVRSRSRALDDDPEITQVEDESWVNTIEHGRHAITREILAQASVTARNFGIELVDVRIKRINYVQDVLVKVYERMISERKRIAEKSRSEGQGRAAEIRGGKERELKRITSEAYKTAQEIRGVPTPRPRASTPMPTGTRRSSTPSWRR